MSLPGLSLPESHQHLSSSLYLHQGLHSLLPPSYQGPHTGQAHTIILQSQVQQAVDKATRELRILQEVQQKEKRLKVFPERQERREEMKSASFSDFCTFSLKSQLRHYDAHLQLIYKVVLVFFQDIELSLQLLDRLVNA